MDRVELGDIAKDIVTGFTGMVVAETHWLHGCRRLGLQCQTLDKEGKPLDTVMFDELQIQLVKAKKHDAKRATGGPRQDAIALTR